jgi:response regulator of citrate/malate metabolism
MDKNLPVKKINKIMLIDDDRISNYINKELLLSMGVADEIIVKEKCKDALLYLQKTNLFPSIIILDIYLPEMNAFEFIEEFKRLGFHKKYNSKIVILTASSDIDDLIRLKYLGKYIYWNKPLQKDRMLTLLTNLSEDLDKKV